MNFNDWNNEKLEEEYEKQSKVFLKESFNKNRENKGV